MKRAFWTTLLVFILLLAPVYVQASPASDINDTADISADISETEEIDREMEDEDKDEDELFDEAMEYLEDDTDMTEEELLDMSFFQINRGLSKAVDPTFDKSRDIVAEGEEGTEVAIFVYEDTEEEEFHLVFATDLEEIGGSGMYRENIDFPLLGMNHVLVYVKKDDWALSRRFCIVRKEEKIKENLENKKYTVGTSDTEESSEIEVPQDIDGDEYE